MFAMFFVRKGQLLHKNLKYLKGISKYLNTL